MDTIDSLHALKDSNFMPTKRVCDQPIVFIYLLGDMIPLALSGKVGLWTIFSGVGGSFADATNPTTIFYGMSGNTYNLIWTITTVCGSSSDTVVIGFASYISCGNPFTDSRDSNTYNTLQSYLRPF